MRASKAERKPAFDLGIDERDDEADSRSAISELRSLRGALRKQNLRFNLVLEKMRQGLCFFDGSKRLIVANRRFAQLYGIAEENIRPGMELREIVDLRFAAGSVPKMTRAEYLEWREGIAIANAPTDSLVELPISTDSLTTASASITVDPAKVSVTTGLITFFRSSASS